MVRSCAAVRGREEANPAVGGVNPAICGPAAGKRPGQQFVGYLVLQLPHLFAAHWAPLAALEILGPSLRLLANDRRGKDLLLHPHGEQALVTLLIEEQAVLMRTNPAAAFHLQSAAGLQRMVRELALKIVRLDGRPGWKPVDNEVLKPHGA